MLFIRSSGRILYRMSIMLYECMSSLMNQQLVRSFRNINETMPAYRQSFSLHAGTVSSALSAVYGLCLKVQAFYKLPDRICLQPVVRTS